MKPNSARRFGFAAAGALGLLLCFSGGLFAQVTITTTTLPNGQLGTVYAAPALTATGGTAPYTWSILTGALPGGLSLTANNGVINGTPTISGTFSFTVRVTDSSAPALIADKVLSISTPPAITTTSLPNGLVNTPYSQSLIAAPTVSSPLIWTVPPGSLPTGLTLSTDGTISGTPTVASSTPSSFTVTVTDSLGLVGSRALSISILPLLTITTNSPLPDAVAGAFYSQSVAASGPSSVSWSVVARILPPGISLSSNGSLVGTPTQVGTFDFTIQAASSSPAQTVTKDFRITVRTALSIITSSALPDAAPGSFYSATLNATGGVPPYTWILLGPLPPGLNFSSDGTISGLTTATGSFSFTAMVTDSFSPAQTTSRTFTIVVPTTLTITTSSVPNGAVGMAYSQTLNATGGRPTYSWFVGSGFLPSGLTISSAGVIIGTPTVAGTFNFTVAVNDTSIPAQIASSTLVITIQPLLSIRTSSTLPLAVVGAFYSQLIEAPGPTGVTWSVISGIVPPGLSLSPSSGALSGNPGVAGTYDFTVQASSTGPVQTDQRTFRIVVNEALRILTAATLPDAGLGVPYSINLEAAGGLAPYTWTNQSRTLPPGLTLSSSGVLSGTATSLGNFSLTLQVTDSFTPAQQTSRTFSLGVPTVLEITTFTIPNAIRNVAYNQQFQATGVGPFTWLVTAGTLPTGLTLTATGVLQGTPVDVGSQTVTVTVTDSRGATVARQFTIVVDPPVPSLSLVGLPATLKPTQPSEVALTLAEPYPSPITGQLKLSFTTKAELPGDDPMTQFSSGARVVNFTIPPNTTSAVFASKVQLLTGTVAGTASLTASFDNGPADVPVATVDIPAIAPQITNVTAIRTAGGVNVQITGYAPAKRVSIVEFSFAVKDGKKTQAVTLTRNVELEFNGWYRNTASAQFGSAFSFLQTFTIQGDTGVIERVTVTLTNAQGTSSVSAPLQ